jgi:hypothetical protein
MRQSVEDVLFRASREHGVRIGITPEDRSLAADQVARQLFEVDPGMSREQCLSLSGEAVRFKLPVNLG